MSMIRSERYQCNPLPGTELPKPKWRMSTASWKLSKIGRRCHATKKYMHEAGGMHNEAKRDGSRIANAVSIPELKVAIRINIMNVAPPFDSQRNESSQIVE
ncbi:hypothetical protein CIHG_07594 [Coccidioides immitis H538.4]|uniref:Predicted protein n=5 Tax=Coccidioides TaxID=5500 RepID=E9CZP7_COCPS|nr:predicted protein [Coccidioides posadasii str. Silveira]KMM73285.1 hypothetical protein CPAG_09574 [Coccidioides posadasii RMSCC 3488]KMP08204.1 hypothetical protein CIRG_07885 [Coccidioides immitis RMSCC 2394]KMU79518.1 hypothetical protein CISG_01936 [Coccidioides immitis RMSCC 3703]KMU89911.1 hypothetical protein CIHG_07594 [Coccidioides immitis H538.4]